MNRPATILAVLFAAAALSGCIAVHDGGHHGDRESCSVKCAAGSRAEVSCEKPAKPACQCEPEVAAACVTVKNATRHTFL